MSKLSEHISTLQENSKQQVESSKEIVKNALNDHENFVRNTLTESRKRIESDIRAHNTRSRQLQLRSWSLAGLTIMLILIAMSGILCYQGKMIEDRRKTINEQDSTIAFLEEETWGIKFLQNQHGRFIILPEDQLINYKWTVDKHQEIQLIDQE